MKQHDLVGGVSGEQRHPIHIYGNLLDGELRDSMQYIREPS